MIWPYAYAISILRHFNQGLSRANFHCSPSSLNYFSVMSKQHAFHSTSLFFLHLDFWKLNFVKREIPFSECQQLSVLHSRKRQAGWQARRTATGCVLHCNEEQSLQRKCPICLNFDAILSSSRLDQAVCPSLNITWWTRLQFVPNSQCWYREVREFVGHYL